MATTYSIGDRITVKGEQYEILATCGKRKTPRWGTARPAARNTIGGIAPLEEPYAHRSCYWVQRVSDGALTGCLEDLGGSPEAAYDNPNFPDRLHTFDTVGGGRRTVAVKARVGDYVIHKATAGKGWAIAHVPSQLSVSPFSVSLAEAKRIAPLLPKGITTVEDLRALTAEIIDLF